MSEKIWYFFEGKYPYEGPYFYNPFNHPAIHDVEKHWNEIREEIHDYINTHENKMTPYFNDTLVSKPKQWRATSFLFWSLKFKNNYKRIPKTMAVLESIPGLVSASLSLLESHTRIKPHHGDTNAIFRCHLGIKIPASLPECGFKVGEQERSWEEGKILMFNDGEWHQAWNQTDQRRYVLLFDVVKPEFLDQKRKICVTVLTAIFWQYVMLNMSFLKSTPRQVRKYFINYAVRPLISSGLYIKSLFD